MQLHLSPQFQGTPEGEEAKDIVRSCVHCGFCTATCPTYQLLGDELDGPRGRIYLMKQVFEGAPATRSTQTHLDRCLTCRNCETTCPSGVQYGRLVELGREAVDHQVPRPLAERLVRWALRNGLTSRAFAPALRLGQRLRPLLPRLLRDKVPPRPLAPHEPWPTTVHPRKVLLLAGCVQPALAPDINGATARVLDAAGIQSLVVSTAGCCGAIRSHLGDATGALDDMRRTIDAWWPHVDAVEAVVVNASGCAVSVKDWGRALAHDPAYAAKAERLSSLTRDLTELLPELVPPLTSRVQADGAARWVFHPPCTLQHGQRVRSGVEGPLRELGFDVCLPASEAHLCCGSAGTYSVLQPTLSRQLRDRKLDHLLATGAGGVLSANIGCLQHLQSGTDRPVLHWVQLLDRHLIRVSPLPVTQR